MESVHGVDVSWIHNTHNKDQHRHIISQSTTGENVTPRNAPKSAPAISKNVPNSSMATLKEAPSTPPEAASQRPGLTRNMSSDKAGSGVGKSGTASPGTGRRGSWLSNFSSKFSSSPSAQTGNQSGASPTTKPPATTEEQPLRPLAWPPKNAVLPHGIRYEGEAPYTPAPPKSGQSNFLSSAFRRLSSSSGQLSGPGKFPHYGLCERRVLNVDTHRERPRIPELDQSKLRRVSFRVDVEIAGGPRYVDDEGEEKKKEKRLKSKLVEKGEGNALKNPDALREEQQKEDKEDDLMATSEVLQKESENDLGQTTAEDKPEEANDKDTSRKKEKKKRSEEERKARKEKKRKLAEANGTLPVELVMNRSDSSLGDSTPGTIPGTPKSQASPTTDPVRIYRRCCQLRETPILKKITEQLSSPTNCGIGGPGVVSKLDLSGYWLQLADLTTLGDYLAVVPIKELVMENCGLTDEGVRVLLAGLLAARIEEPPFRKKQKLEKDGLIALQGGVVERIVFKNNPKIGREGWLHISLFIHMCRSIKCLDLSMIPFPPRSAATNGSTPTKAGESGGLQTDTCEIFAKALSSRFAGPSLELLNMAETGLTTEQLGIVISAVTKSGLRRLGLAGNAITADGIGHISHYLKQGKCEGLDLGGIDLKDHLRGIAESLDENHPLWALSLANCGLTADSLCTLFPALAKLKSFRFIDLSHNHDLFAVQPSALSLLRRYLPKMKLLKRIHLTDCSMTAEQAIALAEILPESPGLAHVSILENPELSALANALDEAQQEEACALYASLMAAVRVSKSIVCIDIDVPSAESSEIVKALAKQVVAYCLRNMERGPVAEIAESTVALLDPNGGEKEVVVPDVLLHIVGRDEGSHENNDDDDEPAPDDDYVIGGTGVVKALAICLRNKMDDSRRGSTDRLHSELDVSGRNSPRSIPGGRAKDMSKNLLGSARKIRARLQPALVKEARVGDRAAYNRLVFLDQTLERMIKRFEDEYPETRIAKAATSPSIPDLTSVSPSATLDAQGSDTEPTLVEGNISDDEDTFINPTLSRHNSDVSLASKALSQEEGRMLRFGQQLRRDILRPETEDHAHGTSGKEVWEPHLEIFRGMLEGLGGDEIRQRVEMDGHEAVMSELSDQASALRKKLMETDPEGWQRFREAQEAAERNIGSRLQAPKEEQTSGSAIAE